MKIYCCGCAVEVNARLTDGTEIYPHRPDLSTLPFWQCDGCGNYVGCHHKTANRTQPLGCIPTPEIKQARSCIHKVLDPLWKTGALPRGKLYAMLSKRIGYQYHTGELRGIADARIVYAAVRDIAREHLKAPE
jgi:hypothetical protein